MYLFSQQDFFSSAAGVVYQLVLDSLFRGMGRKLLKYV